MYKSLGFRQRRHAATVKQAKAHSSNAFSWMATLSGIAQIATTTGPMMEERKNAAIPLKVIHVEFLLSILTDQILERKLVAHDVSVALRGRVTKLMMLKNDAGNADNDDNSKGNSQSNGTTMILSPQPLLHKPPMSDYDTALPPPSPASGFHLMGDLYLSPPSSCGLPEELIQLALKVQRALGELSKRDLRGEPPKSEDSRWFKSD